MTCPHCGFVFEGTAHCPNCGRAPGKPGRDKAYYKEPQKPAQPSEPEVQQGDTQVFTRESRPKQPPVVQQNPKADDWYIGDELEGTIYEKIRDIFNKALAIISILIILITFWIIVSILRYG